MKTDRVACVDPGGVPGLTRGLSRKGGVSSADISLFYTPGDEGVREELVYNFLDVGEIDSFWLELPKSLIESVDSVEDFYAICDWSGLEFTDVTIHDTDPLVVLLRVRIKETNAALSLSERALDIDLQEPGGLDKLIAAVGAQAQSRSQMRELRRQLDHCLALASTTGREREAAQRMQALRERHSTGQDSS